MNVRVRTSETTPTLAQGEFIRRRLENALGVNKPDIEQVDAWILAIDRGHHGPASYCKVDVTLVNGEKVSSDGTEPDLYLAVHRAADRAGWEVSRSLGRQQRQDVALVSDRASHFSRNSSGMAQLAEAV